MTLGGRAAAGTEVRVTREGSRYGVSLHPPEPDILRDIAMSSRIVLFGLEAGLAAHSGPGGLVIAPLLPAAADEAAPETGVA